MSREGLVTTAELARALGLSVRTIQSYRSRGILTPDVVTAGGHARWNIEAVTQALRTAAEKR